MKRLTIAALLSLAVATPTLADGKVFVQLPDLSKYDDRAAESFLESVVVANVVSSNCPGYEITDAEWSLLTDSADLLAYGQLGLSTDDYDDYYYKPAFDLLDQPDTCANRGPGVESVLEELVFQGGSRDPLPDQEKAYEEWRVLMDEVRAKADDAPSQPSGKTKTK